MKITKEFFGKTKDGKAVDIFILTNSKGMFVKITTYGGIVVSVNVPDANGKFDDVVLGFDKLEDYINKNSVYFGAIIGRHGNRIENAEFELNGVEYKLFKNDGENHLHGGKVGFDKVVWHAEVVSVDGDEVLELSYLSKDGEENYPGNLEVKVRYSLSEKNELKIEYFAVSDKDTVVNLTNHSYFNLSGHASGTILKHKVTIDADNFTAIDQYCIPTGEIRSVKGTLFDFTTPSTVEAGLNSDDQQINNGQGYDHNFVLNKQTTVEAEKIAEVFDESTRRVMEVYTTKPGVQLYTGNFLDGTIVGKGNVAYQKWSALCLETQYFPNALKHKYFHSPILKAGEKYNHTTIYKFSVK